MLWDLGQVFNLSGPLGVLSVKWGPELLPDKIAVSSKIEKICFSKIQVISMA